MLLVIGNVPSLVGVNSYIMRLVANEVADDVKRKKKKCLLFIVDFKKIYYLVSWEFLLYMLHRLRFHATWIEWIRGCLGFSWASVLVNGSPTHEFKCLRGLSRG